VNLATILQYGKARGGMRATLIAAQAQADKWGAATVLVTQPHKAAKVAVELGIEFETVWKSSNGSGAELRLSRAREGS
jgi:hypothetical protein